MFSDTDASSLTMRYVCPHCGISSGLVTEENREKKAAILVVCRAWRTVRMARRKQGIGDSSRSEDTWLFKLHAPHLEACGKTT